MEIEPLTPLEIATNAAFGEVDGSPVEADAAMTDPLTALIEGTVQALSRPPCLVSFSGGRDSSLVLAASVEASRRHGLELPIPVSLRYPDDQGADEDSWQDLVLRHLGLDRHIVFSAPGDLELTGPWAVETMRRHGLMYPSNAYLHGPMLKEASGGSLMTGVEGDGLFGAWRWQKESQILRRTRTMRPDDIPGLFHRSLPDGLRTLIAHAGEPPDFGWLRPSSRRELNQAWKAEMIAEPTSWNERIRWWRRRRYLHLVTLSLGAIADDHGVALHHPLMDARFLASLAVAGGRRGLGSKTDALRALFADLLPDEVLARSTKAFLRSAVWGPRSRAFIAAWDGTGVDEDVVDVEALKLQWESPVPNFGTSLLLQQAWLAQNP